MRAFHRRGDNEAAVRGVDHGLGDGIGNDDWGRLEDGERGLLAFDDRDGMLCGLGWSGCPVMLVIRCPRELQECPGSPARWPCVRQR